MLTTRIVNFIGGHEGFVSTFYLDPAGVPTIGHGFTWGSRVFRDWWMKRHGRRLRRGDTMTRAESHLVLLAILDEEAVRPVDALLGGLPQNVREPAYSAAFNLGAGSLRWKWAAALARGAIAEGATLWRTMGTSAGGKTFPGLVRRRAEEADIAEFNRWPKWVTSDNTPPKPHADSADIKQAQLWLTDLGYECGRADGIPGLRTVEATRRFQTDHALLRVDGVIGVATLSALQRAVGLKKASTKVVVGGGAAAGAGVAENTIGAADAVLPGADSGDWLLWGGLLVALVGLVWLAWRYRDELGAAFNKL